MGGVGVTLYSFTFRSTRLGGSTKSSLQFVMQADAPSSNISLRESESNCRACTRGADHWLDQVDVMLMIGGGATVRCFFCLGRLPHVHGWRGLYRRRVLRFMIIFSTPVRKRLEAWREALIHQLLGGLCFLGTYALGSSGTCASVITRRRMMAHTPKACRASPMSKGSNSHRM